MPEQALSGGEYLILPIAQADRVPREWREKTLLELPRVMFSALEEDTARREVREETGAEVRILPGLRHVITYSPSRGVSKEVVMFAARITGGRLRPQPEEVRSVELLPLEEAAADFAAEYRFYFDE